MLRRRKKQGLDWAQNLMNSKLILLNNSDHQICEKSSKIHSTDRNKSIGGGSANDQIKNRQHQFLYHHWESLQNAPIKYAYRTGACLNEMMLQEVYSTGQWLKPWHMTEI